MLIAHTRAHIAYTRGFFIKIKPILTRVSYVRISFILMGKKLNVYFLPTY